MKKAILVLTSLAIAASLVFAVPSRVQAFDWADPVVTPVFGDAEFTAAPTAISKLPGILPNDNGLIQPAGFPDGTTQFGGQAVTVKDLTLGSIAKVCFSMPPKSTEWAGSIFQWNGTKWSKLPTAVSQQGDEATVASACTEIYGDGIYALIMGYTGKPEPKVQTLPVCTTAMRIYSVTFRPYVRDPQRSYMPDKYIAQIMSINVDGLYPIGTPVTYQIINANPGDGIGGALTGVGTVTQDGFFNELRFNLGPAIDFSDGTWLYGNIVPIYGRFTYRFTFPDCYMDIPNPFSFLFFD